MIIRRKSDRDAEKRILEEARKKVATKDTNADFLVAAGKFIEAVKKIRQAMGAAGAPGYDNFFGGYEECDVLLNDPIYQTCTRAQFAYQLLLGANSWLRHEADKLGETYKSPNHFFLAWYLVEHIDIRPILAAKAAQAN